MLSVVPNAYICEASANGKGISAAGAGARLVKLVDKRHPAPRGVRRGPMPRT